MRIALTQSEARLEGLEAALQEAGHAVVRAPLVRTEPRLDAATHAAARALRSAAWLLFSSPSAVSAWLGLKLTLGAQGGPRLGAVGAATAACLEHAGGRVDLVGAPQTAEGLAACFVRATLKPGLPAPGLVGLPRGARALPTLQTRLEAAGVLTRAVVLYDTRLLPWQAGEVDTVVLASPSAVSALPAWLGASADLVSLGPSTSQRIRARGWQPREAPRPDAAAVLAVVRTLQLERLVRSDPQNA